MSYTTSARLGWKYGISFDKLTKDMVAYFEKTELRFYDWKNCGGNAAFRIESFVDKFVSTYISAPWKSNPMLKAGFRTAAWRLDQPDGTPWWSFSVQKEYNPGTTVQVVHLHFDVWFLAVMDSQRFEEAMRKYYQLKELFHAMDCDELVGVNQNCVTALDRPSDPTHRDKDFRFAKEGTQVLIRTMEERRILSDVDSRNSRIFIDPSLKVL